MELPKIDLPVYEVKIPSTGKEIKVRPFTVKEEKLLLLAIETKDVNEIVKTVKQVINNCIVTGDFNVDKAPFYDVDFLFIFLRAKSMGESVSINLTCKNIVKKKECGNVFPSKIDISKCAIEYDKTLGKEFELTNKTGVMMKYPTYAVMKRIESNNSVDIKTSLIAESIESIYDEKGVYKSDDYTYEQLKDFVEGLTEEKFKTLEKFVDNFPTFVVEISEKCTKCGFEHNVRYKDFYDFFF